VDDIAPAASRKPVNHATLRDSAMPMRAFCPGWSSHKRQSRRRPAKPRHCTTLDVQLSISAVSLPLLPRLTFVRCDFIRTDLDVVARQIG
jgi:hypothetical protein